MTTDDTNEAENFGTASAQPSRASANGSAGVLTLAAIKAALADMPPKPAWCEAVMNVECYDRIRNDPVFEDVPMGGFGTMRIYCKPGQTVAAWMFQDHLTAMRYLEGQLTELDLLHIMQTGACQPNEEVQARGLSRPTT